MDTEIKLYVNEALGHKKGIVILEIGAHYGEDTKDMLAVFDEPKIYCFEPDPRNINLLKKTLDKSVSLYEVALSNKDGEAEFLMSYAPYPKDKPIPEKYKWIGEDYRGFGLNNSGGSSLKRGHDTVKDAKSITVKTKKLDTWSCEANVGYADFIWMDVQGSERDVIDGGRGLLRSTAFVWTEYGEMGYEGAMSKKQTVDLMFSLGFNLQTSRGQNMLFYNGKPEESPVALAWRVCQKDI